VVIIHWDNSLYEEVKEMTRHIPTIIIGVRIALVGMLLAGASGLAEAGITWCQPDGQNGVWIGKNCCDLNNAPYLFSMHGRKINSEAQGPPCETEEDPSVTYIHWYDPGNNKADKVRWCIAFECGTQCIAGKQCTPVSQYEFILQHCDCIQGLCIA